MTHTSGIISTTPEDEVPNKPFSEDLEQWLKSRGPKTIASLNEVFGEKSFAVIFVVLMALPALPIPTGAISHVFEAVVMLLCLEMFIGRRSIWLPQKLSNKPLSEPIVKKGLPFLIRNIKKVEKFSRPRLSRVVASRFSLRIHATIIFTLALFAFIAVPFSGLDTLPALGIVIISLGIIFEDIAGTIIGTLVGAAGVALILGIAKLITALF